jgi:hypothetical protein
MKIFQQLKSVLLFCLIVFCISCNENGGGTSNGVDSNSVKQIDTAHLKDSATPVTTIDTAKPKALPIPEPHLISVHLDISVNGDGVDDHGSGIEFNVYTKDITSISFYEQRDRGVGNHEHFERDMTLKDNRLTKLDIKNTILYCAIISDSHDDFIGKPSAVFTYSDGEKISVKYRPFDIGTHGGKSHRTDQPVENW